MDTSKNIGKNPHRPLQYDMAPEKVTTISLRVQVNMNEDIEP